MKWVGETAGVASAGVKGYGCTDFVGGKFSRGGLGLTKATTLLFAVCLLALVGAAYLKVRITPEELRAHIEQELPARLELREGAPLLGFAQG